MSVFLSSQKGCVFVFVYALKPPPQKRANVKVSPAAGWHHRSSPLWGARPKGHTGIVSPTKWSMTPQQEVFCWEQIGDIASEDNSHQPACNLSPPIPLIKPFSHRLSELITSPWDTACSKAAVGQFCWKLAALLLNSHAWQSQHSHNHQHTTEGLSVFLQYHTCQHLSSKIWGSFCREQLTMGKYTHLIIRKEAWAL